MSHARIITAMVRADFLERVRRYSFLLTMGFSVFLGYAVYARQVSLELDVYQGVNNSAWLGSVIALVASVWLTLVGFYVVKNSIERDRTTRVGQILASTPLSKGLYTLGKALSNFAVLALMVGILAVAALLIATLSGAEQRLDLFALLGPILIVGLSAVAITAALAVLFESLPVLRGGMGNVAYFFLWTGLLTMSAMSVDHAGPTPTFGTVLKDSTGLVTVMGQMKAQVHALDPLYNGSASFSVGGLHPASKTFLWTGIHWTSALLLSRLTLLGIAVLIALLAAVFFDRFDPARGVQRAHKEKRVSRAKARALEAAGFAGTEIPSYPSTGTISPGSAGRVTSAAELTPVARGAVRARLGALMLAELRLMLKGQKWWWYGIAAGLFIGCLAAPPNARSTVLAFAWIWPMLAWSQMGSRETQGAMGGLIFSSPRAVPRQLLACYGAGVLLALLTGGGLALRLAVGGNGAELGAWFAGALFIPALALSLGVMTGSRKPFEALYTAWWYIGPMHHVRGLDYMGTTAASSTAPGFALLALVLVTAAYGFRRGRLAVA